MPSDPLPFTGLDAPETVHAWLDAFAAATRGVPGPQLGDLFVDVFVSGDPTGAVAVPKAAFLGALPAREKTFADAGWDSPQLDTATYLPLGEHFGVLLTSWQLSSSQPSGGTLRLRSSFVLRLETERAQAVAYLNDQDLSTLLRTGT